VRGRAACSATSDGVVQSPVSFLPACASRAISASKVVLILGRFSEERKPILDALREALRARRYVPILFDFSGPESRDTTETVTLLARMARFVVADLTDPGSAASRTNWRRSSPTLRCPCSPYF